MKIKANNFKKMDIILIAIYVIITLIMAYFLLFKSQDSGSSRILYIQQGGKVIEKISLPTAGVINRTISDGVHTNEVVIDRNKVYVTKADCHDGLCMKQGEIYKNGDMIVCLPNKLVLEIKSDDNSMSDNEVDTVVK